ncbi:MAG: hypothetical protein NC187_02170 [Candidatus Amulumruptor caecigallinarius]|nr:hypothetical protein [Candidatus Amulumruptor caecigallinarius]MCM1396283.1 hypothetical protein [Candidatus Amulumruptor caecigallinarius]MCM1454277.1 hypothetical protein [bacterium]
MLIDFFDRLRFWQGKRIMILNRLHFYGMINSFVSICANLILSLTFRASHSSERFRLSEYSHHSLRPNIIVSLTSFPRRLPTLHLVIEGLLRQSVKPDKIVLYLTQSQVPDVEKLPHKLLALRKRGLEIRLCPDEIRSHTKYYYAMQEFPEDIVITVDDDLFYRSDLVESLLKHHKEHPGHIIANWVKRINSDTDRYAWWPDVTDRPQASNRFLLLGVSGVLYPPYSLHPDTFNVENIKALSLTADDVWLSAMAIRQGTPIFYTHYRYNHLPVHIRNNETLISGNYVRNQQCVDAINAHYAAKGEPRPFIDIPD